MAKMYIMGKYTEKAYLGFLKDPTTDRKAAVEKLTNAAGGKMLSMDIVCLLYTSPSPRDGLLSRMPSSA